MTLRVRRARTLSAVLVFGLICAVAAAGAAVGGSSYPPFSTKKCERILSKKLCKAPKRYDVSVNGTITLRHGGTETFSIDGTLERVAGENSLTTVDYPQVAGTMTQTYRNVGGIQSSQCDFNGLATGNSGATTTPLPVDGFEIYFSFRLGGKGTYEVSSAATQEEGNVPGTATCDYGGGSFPVSFRHRFTGTLTRKGRPRKVVTGSASYGDVELYKYQFNWKLTAKK